MKFPTVSLIVPTFNRSAYLKLAVESLIRQTHPFLELLIVDDGSTDDTAEVVKGLPGNPIYLRKDNGGRAAAINLGVEHARGDLIWVFDDDDIARPESLQLLIAPFLTGDEVDFTYGAWYLCDEQADGSLAIAGSSQSPMLNGSAFFYEMLFRCFTQGNAMLIARRCYDAIGPMREDLIRSQDHEYMLRLSRKFNATPVTEPIFYWRRHLGPRGAGAGKMFGASQLNKKWHLYRQKIFIDVHRELPLSDYLPKMRRSALPANEREALLTRSVVMSCHGLWSLAITDLLQLLAQRTGDGAWTADEHLVFGRLSGAVSSDALRDLIDAGMKPQLMLIARHQLGWDFVKALLRGARWAIHNHLRDGERHNAWRITRALVASVGIWSILRAVVR